jgi:hypothetical protein
MELPVFLIIYIVCILLYVIVHDNLNISVNTTILYKQINNTVFVFIYCVKEWLYGSILSGHHQESFN